MNQPNASGSKCITCNVAFTSLSEMREHFTTDFHAHNVRLRVDGRNPMSKAQFRDAANGEDVGDERPQFACTLCKKTFRSMQTLQSHVRSTEHLMRKEKRIIARDSEAASMLTSTSLGSAALGLHRRNKTHNKNKHAHVDPTKNTENAPKVSAEHREEDVSETSCLFCGHQSKTIKSNLQHMKTVHSFTVPLEHRCTDVEGLLSYLARKINGCMCLVCGLDSKSFSTLNGVRSHMAQVKHEYIVLGPEYEEFYEGGLDDPEEKAEAPETEDNGQLVLMDGKKVVSQRRADGVQNKFRKETDSQMEARRQITMANQAANAVILRERQAATAVERKKEQKIQLRAERTHHRWMANQGWRNNLLHPKGFDGEGLKSGN